MLEHAEPAIGKQLSRVRWFEAGNYSALMKARARGTQMEVIRMARTLHGSFVLVFSGINVVFPVSSSRGLLSWSWPHKCSHWVSFRYIVLPLSEGVGCSKSILSICVWCLKSVLWFISVRDLDLVLTEGVWVGYWAYSVAVGYLLEVESILCVLGCWVLHSKVWFSIWLLLVCELLLPHSLSFSIFIPLLYSVMARCRGIPRRGSSSGSRGGSGGRGSSAPRRISPLATASPSSPPSDYFGPSLNSSLHTSRFKFKSRLNRPLISAIITVIFSEEEDELTSSAETSKEQWLSQNSSDSQSSLAGAVLKVSAAVHEAGQ